MPAEVEDERAPILVRAFARVVMLVKRGAVKAGKRPIIARKVRRHPVHQHADARLVQRVDQILKIIRRAEAARRRVKPGDLIAPGRIKRVFRNRQEFNMREAHFPHVVNQWNGNLTVAERFGHRFLAP